MLETFILLLRNSTFQNFLTRKRFNWNMNCDIMNLMCPKMSTSKVCPLLVLCKKLAETGKSICYPLVDKLLWLVFDFSCVNNNHKSAFSVMKIIKTRLHNKMEDDFLTNYMIIYIEKQIVEKFITNIIIDYFPSMKKRQKQLQKWRFMFNLFIFFIILTIVIYFLDLFQIFYMLVKFELTLLKVHILIIRR